MLVVSYAIMPRRVFALQREIERTLLTGNVDAEREFYHGRKSTARLFPRRSYLFRERYPQVTLHITILTHTRKWRLELKSQLWFSRGYLLFHQHFQVEVFAHDELVLVVSPWHRSNSLASPGGSRRRTITDPWGRGSGIREVIEQVYCFAVQGASAAHHARTMSNQTNGDK